MIIPEKLKKSYKDKILQISECSFDKSMFIDEQLLADICEITGATS